jgi:hypothetical protein
MRTSYLGPEIQEMDNPLCLSAVIIGKSAPGLLSPEKNFEA